MQKINRIYLLWLWLAFCTLMLPTLVSAQQPLFWETNLENAQRLAASTNRLVLIHFGAPWCGACKKMDDEVLSQPTVRSIIQANYVPVKIDPDRMPSIAKQFGVSVLPYHVIITPQGRVLDSMRGRLDSSQFILRINQVVAVARQQNANQTAQVRASIPAQPSNGSVAQALPTNNRQSASPVLSDDRYADYFRSRAQNNVSDAPNNANPNASAGAVRAQPSPSYARQAPIAAPNLNAQTQVQTPVTIAPTMPGGPLLPGTAPGTNLPQQSTPAPGAGLTGAAANMPQQVQAPANPALPALTASLQRQVAPPAKTPAAPTKINPPLCLDGYCPVSLVEKHEWVAGDRRWGAIHRGRTYLFAGAEEQKRFFTDPDRYAPVLSGNDVVLTVDKGQNVPGLRQHGVKYNNHVFLFANENSLAQFSKNSATSAYYANKALQSIQASNHPVQALR
ncbi:MAG: thioredoxin family protein [Thermoguttaceae bacterium]